MKKNYSTLVLVLVATLYCSGQTVLPYDKYLTTQYNINFSSASFYATSVLVTDNSKENVFAFFNNSGDLSYNGQTITANGTAAVLLQIKTATGELTWSTSLGNSTTPLYSVESAVKDPNGNITISARGTFTAGVPLTLGTQTFTFRTDMLPNMVFATLNPTTHVWSKVRFLYAPDQSGYTAEPKYDNSGNLYICGTVTTSALYIDNTTVESVAAVSGTNIFVYKENTLGTVVYNKQTVPVNPTGMYNVSFELDNSDNLFVTGYISYITGAISMDGVVVKNDTLSNAYDYSYSDIFLYKINPAGIVQFGKTYLYSGNEAPNFLHALTDGNLLLFGEYNGSMNGFPGTSGDLFYNRFISKISGSTGAFIWSYPINSNVYYQERYPFHALFDENGDSYFTVNFCPNSISFMGQTYQKRNSTNGTSNTLVAKVNSDGVLQWANVLGPVTTFETSYVDNPRVDYGMLGSKRLVLQVNNLSYGTNTDFAWGSGAVPTTTMPAGYLGNMAVVNKKTGEIANGYYQKFTETIELDSLSFFALKSDYGSWMVTLFKPQGSTGLSTVTSETELFVYPNPVSDELFIRNMPATSRTLYIYSLEGKTVLKSLPTDDKVSVKDLPDGIYTVRVGERFSRFVKIR